MDVVRSNIERIGGIVEVDSKPGEGTRMTLRVPLTLTIIPALTVSIGGQHFAIPRSAIEEIVRANGESVTLEQVGGAGVATIRGRRVPEVALADILGLDSDVDGRATARLIVLRPAGGDVYALAVDRIHDHEELVVKPAAPAVMATGLYAGTTLADDGSPILLFDPAGLAEVGGVKLEAQERAARIAEGAGGQPPRRRHRSSCSAASTAAAGRSAWRSSTASRKSPPSAIRTAAGQLRVQLGEAILPLAGRGDSDAAGATRSACSASTTARTRSAMPSAKSSTSRRIDHDVIPADVPGEVSGVTLIDGEPAELIDAHWLFANHVGARRAAGASRWSAACRATIRGCRTCCARSSRRPAIASSATTTTARPTWSSSSQGAKVAEGAAERTIWLRAEPEAAGKKDDSIYRYDRAGLLMALKSAGAGGADERACCWS